MIRDVWRKLGPLLPARGRLAGVEVAVESLLAGVLEALVLVLVVSSALVVTGAAHDTTVSMPGGSHLSLSQALWAAGAAAVAMLVLHLRVAHVGAHLSAAVLESARDRALRSYSRATWARQSQDREGAVQETASSLSVQTSILVMYLTQMASGASGLLVLLLAALVVDVYVTLVVLGFGAVLFLALRPLGRITQRTSQEFVRRNSDFAEQITEWSGLAMDLRVFGVEDAELDRLRTHGRATAAALATSRFATVAGVEVYRDVAVIFLVAAVAGLHLAGDAAIASIGAVVLLVVRSLSYAQMTNAALQKVYELSPNLDSLMARVASLEEAREQAGPVQVDRIGGIELRAVGYSYSPDRVGVADVTLAIRAGEALGVIGPSGGGKSTLVQVLLRLRPPTAGAVLVDGLPYGEVAAESWQRLVALVPQEPRLFQGTVAENIAFLRDIERDDIEQAAKDANVFEDIQRLPLGFETPLGPRGAGLSGGQKQRIAIARALVGRPQLLVLDEPTSALDVRSEELLKETIEELKGGVTLVIVAHRLTTLASCDRVVGMQGGRVRVVGSLEEALSVVSLGEIAATPTDEGTMP